MKRLVLALMLVLAPAAVAQEHAAAPAHGAAAEAGGHGESGGGGHDSLGTWKWINFGILAAVLVWAIAKNAPPFFQARIDEIQKDIKAARQVKEEAEARAAAIEKRLAGLDTELAALRTDARREMEAESVRIAEETRRAVASAGQHAEQEIAAMSKTAENELRREASRLALELAEKKLKARMSPEAENSMVTRFVAGLRPASKN